MLTAFSSDRNLLEQSLQELKLKANHLLHIGVRMHVFRAAGQHLVGKAVLTSFSSDIRFQIRTRSKSSYTHGQTVGSKVKQESEEKNDTDADKVYGKRRVIETWAMRKAGLRRLSKCELIEEYKDSVRQNIKQI